MHSDFSWKCRLRAATSLLAVAALPVTKNGQNFECFSLRKFRRVPPPCAVKACAVHPVFARVVGELRAADPSNVQGPVKQNATPGEQSEAPRPRWKPGQEQHPGPENQDSQHMLKQPRKHFPENSLRLRRAQRDPSDCGCDAVVHRFSGVAQVQALVVTYHYKEKDHRTELLLFSNYFW